MAGTILHHTEDGAEFWTVGETGESFISAEGLAKKCGVSYEALELLAANIEEGKARDPEFRELKNGCEWMLVSGVSDCPLDGQFAVPDRHIARYLSHFAKNGNLTAIQELQDFIKLHGHPFFQGLSVFEWLKLRDMLLNLPELDSSAEKKAGLGFVYLIGCPDLNVAKIGFSTCVESRLRALQTSFPFKLSILAVKKGTLQDEKAMHDQFAEFRLEGEWFALCERSKQLFADAYGDGLQGEFELAAE